MVDYLLRMSNRLLGYRLSDDGVRGLLYLCCMSFDIKIL